MDHPMRNVGDIAAVATAFGTITNYLPAVAALFSIIWTGMRIVELVTGQPFSQCKLAKWISGRA